MSTTIVTPPAGTTTISAPAVIRTTLVAMQGPPGPPGTPGSGSPGDYLQTTLRLAEFSTPEARAAARANLELQDIDGGTFN